MLLYDVIWKIRFIEKISGKHNVTTDEVEEVLFGRSHFSSRTEGPRPGRRFVCGLWSDGGRAVFDRFVYSKEKNRGLADFSPRHERFGAKIL